MMHPVFGSWENVVVIIHFYLFRLAPYWVEWGVMIFPLAIYLLFLAYSITNKNRPVMLSRRKDYAFLVLGLSGFLLIGPLAWVVHPFFRLGLNQYLIGYGLFALALICFLGSRLLKVKGFVIYNIKPEQCQANVEEALRDLNFEFQVSLERHSLKQHNVTLDYEANSRWHVVSVKTEGDETIISAIRKRLGEKLDQLRSDKNPAQLILSLWGGLCLLISAMSIVLYFWYLREM